ncbi:MAG: GNAT family N-acetyltransferase [Proteobacteria bacterium]|nr:GNAT family N-acetyltransferase [Pseudomonadota bacterium]
MSGCQIRPAVPSDGQRVAEMAAALSAHEGEPPPPFDADSFRRYGFGAERRFDTILAEDQGRIIGYVLFCDSFHVGVGTPGLHMIDLFVEPAHRRSGAGRSLVGALSRICLERGGTWITWQCQPGNVEALEFYDRIKGRRFAAANFELTGDALGAIADAVPGTD